MNDASLIIIIISALLVKNFVLSQFLGICPFLGVSTKLSTALGMGCAVTFVMTIASFVTRLLYGSFLVTFKLEYLQTIMFILVIAALVQLVEIILKKLVPPLYRALGIYLPLITTNCAVLGVALLNINEGFDVLRSTVYGFAAGLGFTLALILFAGVREKLEYSNIPESFKGLPIALISAAFVSLAFFGFQGLLGI
ncbi:electron transport complex subunit RsxA [Acetivibrio straminisolvens]|jgi:electron transport complex protein RnfA|uniref:Ion-translocating oxidoreductase complex subunit A n=1 Tax=Acetivibrio straminisolvens JCM 21531 TaxID=1294263 RepID=W4V523_9FIRM|nr:electron transport complex subunit RsxA [Acetivibrio straminisolvens]GAE88525.1 electron transport complex protein RnfA [Acetivibrio straminisolvens JCM 21531]